VDEITKTPTRGRPPKLDKMTKDNFMLPPQIRKPLQAMSDKTGRPKSELVREALTKFLAGETV
jgi:predicted DNA-binding protein